MRGKFSKSIAALLVISVTFAGAPSAAAAKQTGREISLRKAENTSAILDATGNFYYAVNQDGTATVISYAETKKNVTVPDTLDGHVVTIIGKQAFSCRTTITKITLPSTLLKIEDSAFEQTSISSMVIPDGVVSIGAGAFVSCRELEKISLPKSVTELKDALFDNTPSLVSIEVNAENPSYTTADGILFSKDMTKIVAVPQGLKLKKYTIPDSVTCIGAYAFCNNSSLQSIEIPDKVTELGNNAFYSCRALINIVLGTGITSIPQGAFMGCIELQKVTINGSLISVGEDAFYDCSSLEVINLPDTLQTIEKNAFFDCSNLKKITLPANIVKIEDYSIGYFEEGKGDDICIKGVYGTQAQLYAEKLGFAFENAETGEVIYYNLKKMEKEEIVSVTSLKKKQISLLYLEMYGAKYQIRIRVKGTSAWKQYTASHAGETIKKLKSGKTYQVKVRAYGNVEGTAYYSKWSSVKKVKVK